MRLPSIVAWEWRKLRGRRMVWALLATLVLFASAIVFLRFGEYRFAHGRDVVDEIIYVPGIAVPDPPGTVNCTALLESGTLPTGFPSGYSIADMDVPRTQQECGLEIRDVERRLAELVHDFTLPGAVDEAVRWATLLGIPVIALLTVLVVGSEYVWGTLRTSLMNGVGRVRFLVAKLLLVGLVLAGLWAAVVLAVIASSLTATAMTSGITHGEWVTVGFVGESLEIGGRAWTASLPYVALATVFAILLSRSAGGMLFATVLATGYFFFELFTIGRLVKLFDGVAGMAWFSTTAEYDLGWNTTAWLFASNGEPLAGFALGRAIGTGDFPGDVHALAVQMAFLVVLGCVGVWLFRRRDVVGPTS